MTKKKTLSDYSLEEMRAELDRRWAVEHYKPGMTMSQMELTVWNECGMESPAALRLLSAHALEKPTGKICPKCGKRAAVKSKVRARTLRTMAGYITLARNCHHCERRQLDSYSLDRLLEFPEDEELTHEMEKRVLDFAVNDVFNQGAERWNVHFREPISDNVSRHVAARTGARCESTDQSQLQEALNPSSAPAEILVAQVDGSMLPLRGAKPWKEAKLSVMYRHEPTTSKPVKGSARYVALVGTVANFAPVFQTALFAERIDDMHTVVWLADGAPHNLSLAGQLAHIGLDPVPWTG